MIELIREFKNYLEFKKQDERCKKYPCINYLNRALRALLEDENPNMTAISEISYCIRKANGEYEESTIDMLRSKGLVEFI